jgi:hypothetical protein
MIRTEGKLIFVGLCYVLLPAFLMHVNSTFGAVVSMGSGFFTTDGTFHDSLPLLSISFFLNPSALALLSFSSLESVT